MKQGSYLIEKTLKSLGFETKIEGINIEPNYYEFCLQVAIGTNLSELEKHDRYIANKILGSRKQPN